MSEPITEVDLLAYVDDQLDVTRRIEVEDYLAHHPEAAAQVMSDLRNRDTLRLTFSAELPRPREAIFEAAAKLERGLAWRALGQRLSRLAAVAALVAIGWLAHEQVGLGVRESEASPKLPAFVEDAVHSHETALLRASMASQPETAEYNPGEIATATGIELPALPGDWRILDAQVFPSRGGHSVEIAMDAGDLGRVSLFAARVSLFNVIAPTSTSIDQTKAVYWQTGSLAYAVTGTGSDKAIERAAMRLAGKLQ